MGFSPEIAENLLVKSARHCCLCRRYKGTKLEVHHIVPESRGGSDDEENGIPLCFECHAEVAAYNEEHPRGRKFRPSELRRHRDQVLSLVAQGKLLESAQSGLEDEDVELIRFYSQCFDRPAFQDRFHQEGSMEAFDKAMEDTITAFNTGCLRSRDGQVLSRAKGKSYLSNPDWRRKLDVIVDLLRAIRSRYSLAIESGQIQVGREHDGRQWYCIREPELSSWMDATRVELLQIFSEICKEAGVPTLRHPPFRGRRGW